MLGDGSIIPAMGRNVSPSVTKPEGPNEDAGGCGGASVEVVDESDEQLLLDAACEGDTSFLCLEGFWQCVGLR